MSGYSRSMRFALALMFVVACGGKSNPPSASESAPPAAGSDEEPAAAECVKGGCSGTVCAEPDKQVMTTCEYRAEYACYANATCERQADGNCGWTQTPELSACLASPPPMQ